MKWPSVSQEGVCVRVQVSWSGFCAGERRTKANAAQLPAPGRRFGQAHKDADTVPAGVGVHIHVNVRFPIVASPDIASLVNDHARNAHQGTEAGRVPRSIERVACVQEHLLAGGGKRITRGR